MSAAATPLSGVGDCLMADSVKKVAYDVASSTIALQHQALTNLRARAATIVAGSALVASFVGAPALESGTHTFWLAAGLVAFVAALIAAGCVLWPYPFEFRINARQLLDVYASATSDAEVDPVYAHIAARLADAHAANEQVIHRLHGVFQIGLLALGVETLTLLMAIG